MSRSMELNPNNPMSLINWGFLLQRMKRYDDAFEAFDWAIDIDPDFGMGYHYRGKEHFYAGNMQAAVTDLTRAMDLGAQVPASHYWRSRCYAEMNQRSLAVHDAQRAQQLGYELPHNYLLSLQAPANNNTQ